MHVKDAVNPECWSALDFIDDAGNYIERKLKIVADGKTKPPAGGKEKFFLVFEGDPRKCFLANGEIKAVMNILRRPNTADWKGAVLLMTAGPKKFSGKPVEGMVVKNAAFPAPKPGA
jgi:hypothetical protein